MTLIHAMNNMNVIVTGVRGSAFFSFETSIAITVTPAMIAAKGKFLAKPQPCECGFMTLIQTHNTTPI